MQVIDASVELLLKDGRKITGINYADVAEEVMEKESKRDRNDRDGFFNGYDSLTTTSLRSIYSMIMNISTEIEGVEEFERRKGDLQYLKVRMAYEAGRKGSVKKFLKATGLDDAISSVATYDQFLLFCRYAESLVAYFKFYGGKE